MAFLNEKNSNMSGMGGEYNSPINDSGVEFKLTPFAMKQYMQFIVFPSDRITSTDKRNLQALLHRISLNKSYDESEVNNRYTFKFLRELVDLVNDKKLTAELLVDHFLNKVDKDNGYPKELASVCLKYVRESLINPHLFTADNITSISIDISQKLKYLFMYEYVPKLNVIGNKLKMSEGLNLADVYDSFLPVMQQFENDMRDASVNSEFANASFVIGKDEENDPSTKASDDNIYNVIKQLKSPNNKLKTGFKQLNNMFGGGFEGSRVYTFAASPKKFKSGLLLNLAISTTKFNKNYQPKDPSKRPAIIYLTMENSDVETYNRIYKYATGDDAGISGSNQSWEEIKATINSVTSGSNIKLITEYQNTGRHTTQLIDDLIDHYESEGYEIVMVVQDYIKRIKPKDFTASDTLRDRLGAVVDDFEIIAKTRQIPIVTAAQLNRESYRIIEEYARRGTTDVAKELNQSQIADSSMIVENTDYMIIINREELFTKVEWIEAAPQIKDLNKSFLSFKLVTNRDTGAFSNDSTYFAQPFVNNMKLEEDADWEDGRTAGVYNIASERTKILLDPKNAMIRDAVASKGLVISTSDITTPGGNQQGGPTTPPNPTVPPTPTRTVSSKQQPNQMFNKRPMNGGPRAVPNTGQANQAANPFANLGI